MHSEDILMLIFMACCFIVAIVAMALAHHRKLAEIATRSKATDDAKSEGLRTLQASVDELRTQLHAQMIQVDTLLERQAQLPGPPHSRQIQGRLAGDEPQSAQ